MSSHKEQAIALFEAAQAGYMPALSVEAYLTRIAKQSGKPVLELESIEQQFELFEGASFATQVALNNRDEVLRDRIGEQKIILGDLLMLLRPYSASSGEYQSLFSMIEDISRKYADVRVSYRLGEPETSEVDGRLIMVQHEESIVEMSDAQLAEIAELSKEVRNKLISGIEHEKQVPHSVPRPVNSARYGRGSTRN